VSRVLVIGGSDQGRQVIDAIVARGFHTAVGVLDRTLSRGTDVMGIPVLGSDDELLARAAEVGADHFVVAIGDNATRGRILERESTGAPHLEPATIVHPSAVLGSGSTLGPGSIVLAGAVVGNGCHIGRGVLFGIRSSLDHDGVVADHASLGPGATTGGNVRIGRATAVGLGASVIHGVTIGADTVIGAGAVVLDDVPDRVVAYGVPARVARNREPDDPYLSRPQPRSDPGHAAH
jgi:sugar O-acyltransferase (sialic acid O-acetyltransferase NeuD family)